jgi:uncharacterized protein
VARKEKISEEKLAGKKNRLASETSPYLLQHSENPVDWYPWGREAFEKAKRENKPIFLSIGYSSCHWCHVMAHESFEDPEVAKILNENFVPIKVDREERPDIDEIYMKSVVSITGSGGWPLNVFLTPSLEPFYGGTYFPPSPRYGMPSFSNVIRNISQSWKSDRKRIAESASQMKSSLAEMYNFKKGSESKIGPAPIEECYELLASSFDELYGGFGNAPKFPSPSNLFFLMRYYHGKKNSLALPLKMVRKTLDGMMRGGINDQVGGGFHRYSTDRYWVVPHFEKMLYDNALLIQAYTEAYLLTKDEEYARLVRETVDWAIREMKSVQGGFYSAIDADSKEGEGVFYTWTLDEFSSALSAAGFKAAEIEEVARYFSVTRGGSFEEGRNVLTAKSKVDDHFRELIERAKEILLKVRGNRERPSTDDKILAGWNGLMISALGKAFGVFGEPLYLKEANSCANFILEKMCTTEKDGELKLGRSYRSDQLSGDAFLEDYSFLINGFIDLYEADFNIEILKKALALANTMINEFNDQAGGGFYQAPSDASHLIVRAKDSFDGAIPSGNSLAALALLRLAEITGNEEFRNKGTETILAFWESIVGQPASFTEMLVGLQFLLAPPKEIVISGTRPEFDGLLKVVRDSYLPNSVIVLAAKETAPISTLVDGRLPLEGQPSRVFVCSNCACNLPSSSEADLRVALSS